jgi:hypothetical protein
VYLRRLNLTNNRGSKYIYICNKHQLVRELHEITWKNINKQTLTYTTTLVVPRNPDNVHMTRSVTETIYPVSIRTYGVKQKRRNEEPRVRKKQKPKRKCHFVGCNSTSDPNKVGKKGWSRVQPPVVLTSPNQRCNRARKLVAYKKCRCENCLILMGLSRDDSRFEVRMCNKHETEIQEVLVPWIDTRGRSQVMKKKIRVPTDRLIQEEDTEGRRTSIERIRRHELAEAEFLAKSGEKEAAISMLMMLWDFGDNHHGRKPSKPRRLGGINDEITEKKKVIVSFETLTDRRVKIQTGFPSILAMLAFISVVSNGNIDEITNTTSTLTWLEEWYLYFEIIYGKTISRYVDAIDKYDSNDREVRRVFDIKLQAVKKVRKEWPMYCSLKEDETYRKPNK